jgi:hypothetical protein
VQIKEIPFHMAKGNYKAQTQEARLRTTFGYKTGARPNYECFGTQIFKSSCD